MTSYKHLSTDQTTILVNGKAYLRNIFNSEEDSNPEYEKLDSSFKETYQ